MYISTTPVGLQSILDICAEYARNWHFRFNAKKSSVVQFSLNNRNLNTVQFPWKIDNEVIPIEDGYTHLGIELDSKFRSRNRTINSCRKGRSSCFALKGINCKSTSPLVLIRLYKSIVLPTMLYGCEMWSNLKTADYATLNLSQHFILKYILKLKTSTRSDMCQSLVGLHPIASVIEKRKLYFLQKLCTLDDKYITENCFLTRLFSHLYESKRTHQSTKFFLQQGGSRPPVAPAGSAFWIACLTAQN